MKHFIWVAVLLSMIFGLVILDFDDAGAQTPDGKNLLEVRFANNVAESYIVRSDSGQKYTISQSYSWVRDDSSRYSLISYSIDNNGFVDIPRKARGVFTLDMPMDSDHIVTFAAAVQYPVSAIVNTNGFADAALRFDPSSPTGDNWFDAGTSVSVKAPFYVVIEEGRSRLQLTGWTLDSSNLNEISLSDESQQFSSPSIAIASPHSIEFYAKKQYYLNVVSPHGTLTGAGWYDSGSRATVNVKPESSSFPTKYVFEGSDGTDWSEGDAYTTEVVMDSPKTIVLKWRSDHTLVTIIAGALVAVAIIIVILKRGNTKSARHLTKPLITDITGKSAITAVPSPAGSMDYVQNYKQENQIVLNGTGDSDQRSNGDKYARDLLSFSLAKSIETLESMHGAGLISESRVNAIKQKLDQSIS